MVIAIVGVWNLLVGGYTLSVIKEVVRRSCHVQGPLLLISIGGAGWALFATIWLGGWFQLLLIPLHMGVGVLAWTNSAYFDSGRGRRSPRFGLPRLPAMEKSRQYRQFRCLNRRRRRRLRGTNPVRHEPE